MSTVSALPLPLVARKVATRSVKIMRIPSPHRMTAYPTLTPRLSQLDRREDSGLTRINRPAVMGIRAVNWGCKWTRVLFSLLWLACLALFLFSQRSQPSGTYQQRRLWHGNKHAINKD